MPALREDDARLLITTTPSTTRITRHLVKHTQGRADNRGMAGELDEVAARVWRLAGGSAEVAGVLAVSGPRSVWPAFFDVTGLAAGSVAAAALAAAELLAARNQTRPRPVSVDSRAACGAFAAERLFTSAGWSRPELWDPLAGNYRAGDGWIRLHTNYRSHRAAAGRLLGAHDRDSGYLIPLRYRRIRQPPAVLVTPTVKDLEMFFSF